MSNLGTLPTIKSPIQSWQRGPLAVQLEKNIQQRALLASDPLMPLAEVRLVLNCSYSQVRKLIANGSLRIFRIGKGHIKVRQSVLMELLAKGDQP